MKMVINLLNTIMEKWGQSMIFLVLIFMVINSKGDIVTYARVVLIALAWLFVSYPRLSFGFLIMAILINLFRGYYFLTILILFFIIIARVLFSKKVKGFFWLKIIFNLIFIFWWVVIIGALVWPIVCEGFSLIFQAFPKVHAMPPLENGGPFNLSEEIWRKPSWLNLVGAAALVEGHHLSPFDNLWLFLKEKEASAGYPCRAALAENEIEPLVEKLQASSEFNFSTQVQDNLKNILNDWKCEPLLCLSNLLEDHRAPLASLENFLVGPYWQQTKLCAFHLYNNCALFSSHNEVVRWEVLWKTPTGPLNGAELTNVQFFHQYLNFTCGEKNVQVVFSEKIQCKQLSLPEINGGLAVLPLFYFDPEFVHTFDDKTMREDQTWWGLEGWSPPVGENPNISAFSQFFEKKVAAVEIRQEVETGDAIVITFGDGTQRDFPVQIHVAPNPFWSAPGLMLWPDRICYIEPDKTYFFIPPTGLFISSSLEISQIPVNSVWGAPFFYKGVAHGSPLDFLYPHGNPKALVLVKSLIKNNIFHDMSLYQAQMPNVPPQGILKNYLLYVKKFVEQDDTSCPFTLPDLLKVRKEILNYGSVPLQSALRFWLYRSRRALYQFPAELVRKTFYLPNKGFMKQVLRQRLLRELCNRKLWKEVG